MKTVLTGLALAATLASEVEVKNGQGNPPPAKLEMKARRKEVDARTTPAVQPDKAATEGVPARRIRVLSVREIPGRCQ